MRRREIRFSPFASRLPEALLAFRAPSVRTFAVVFRGPPKPDSASRFETLYDVVADERLGLYANVLDI